MDDCTEDRFFNDIKNHTMNILRDDGVSRHISFSNNGSYCYRFDLITWSGHLCISGDCGTYVFCRIEDMFEFFRVSEGYKNNHPERKLFINKDYWGEKLLSIGTNAGYKEYCEEAFRERVKDHFDSYWEGADDISGKDSLWSKLEDQVLSTCVDEHLAYSSVHEFDYEGFYFQDFFDGGSTERYTFRYLWCLYAISYGVSEYDKHTKGNV